MVNIEQESQARTRELIEEIADLIERRYPIKDPIGYFHKNNLSAAKQIVGILASQNMGWGVEGELPKEREGEPEDSDYNYKYFDFGDICNDAQQDMIKSGYRLHIPVKGE